MFELLMKFGFLKRKNNGKLANLFDSKQLNA